MFRVAFVAGALLLVGCGGPKLTEMQASCEQRHGNFSGAAQCLGTEVRTEVARNPGRPNEDLALVYAAWMGAAAERVQAGEMGEADARLGAAELYSRLKSIRDDRVYAANADYATRYGGFLQGLAVWNQLRQPVAPARDVITCHPIGGGAVQCY